MNIKILQAENSIENVSNSVISALYNAHINGDISLEVDENNQKVGLVGSITAPTGYAILVSTLNSAYPKFHVTVTNEYIQFKDSKVESALMGLGIGDGTGISMANINTIIVNNTKMNLSGNTDIEYFPEAYLFGSINLFKFLNCTNLKEIGVGSTTWYDNYMFSGCDSLEKIIIYDWVTWYNYGGNYDRQDSRPNYANTNIKEFVDGSGNNYIRIYEENNKTIKELTLPSGCTEPHLRDLYRTQTCFAYSDINKIILPSTVTIFGASMAKQLNTIDFTNATNLTRLMRIFNKNLSLDVSTLPQSITTIDYECFTTDKDYGNVNTDITGNLTLPYLISLGAKSFFKSGITKISNLGSITLIEDLTFLGNTYLTQVTLPSTCTTINKYGFSACTGLTNINLGGVTSFGYSCFYNCTSLTISPSDIANATSIGSNAFNGPSISGAITLNNLTSLGDEVFTSGANITSLDLSGSTITSIGKSICRNSPSLTTVKLPNTLRSFGINYNPNPFPNCNITILTGTEGITSINNAIGSTSGISNAIPLLSYEIGLSFIVLSGETTNAFISQAYLPKFKYNSRTGFEWFNGIVNQTMFTYRSLTTLFSANMMYFKDLEKILVCMFWGTNITNLVINNATPPAFDTTPVIPSGSTTVLNRNWDTKMFGDISTSTMTIYVPNSVVSTYQADSNYNAYTILGIGSLNNGVIYATEDDWVAANKPNGLIAEYLGLNTADLATFMSDNNLTYWTNPNE